MPAAESPILVDVWTVDPARREELLGRISKVARDLILKQPGFVSAQLYESTDGGAVMVSVRMRSVKDRLKLTDSPEVHAAMRELRAIGQNHTRLYKLVEDFGDPQ